MRVISDSRRRQRLSAQAHLIQGRAGNLAAIGGDHEHQFRDRVFRVGRVEKTGTNGQIFRADVLTFLRTPVNWRPRNGGGEVYRRVMLICT